MPYIYQSGRAELVAQIGRHKDAVSGRVLDIGGGSFSRYRDLFSCDEYAVLDVAEGRGVDVVGNIVSLPFPNNSFDSIVCTQVLGDVYELPKAFSEIFRVLKSGGRALITEGLFDSLHDEPHDFWRFTVHAIRRLAEDAGLQVEVLENRGGFWSVRAQMTTRYLIERFGLYRGKRSALFNLFASPYGRFMLWLDRHDGSRANHIFTHGFLLIARKP
jgi:SAM-dependent methyltransferase